MASSFNVIALLYVVFMIKELKPLASKTDSAITSVPQAKPIRQGSENPAYEITQLEELQTTQRSVSFNNGADAVSVIPNPPIPKSRNFIRDFFDPTLVVDYVKFPMKKRPNRGRMLLLFLIMAYMFTVGPALGEIDFWNRFTFRKLNWNGNDYSVYSTFNAALALAGKQARFANGVSINFGLKFQGTFIGTAILSKLLKLSDAMVGFVSTVTTAGSRVLFVSKIYRCKISIKVSSKL